MSRLIKIWQLGQMSYTTSLKLQNQLASLHHHAAKTAAASPAPNDSNTSRTTVLDTLLFLEHSPVYTVGLRSNDYSADEEAHLKSLGADFCRTNRGGLITFHGPGQLVVYPVINLKNYQPSIKWYVCQIERTAVEVCRKFGIDAHTSEDTGVWVGNNKICAIGLHGSRFVTTHGLALNCDVDLTWFDHIVPCGLPGKGVTSLSRELGRTVTVEEVAPIFLDTFCELFECTYVDYPRDDVDQILAEI